MDIGPAGGTRKSTHITSVKGRLADWLLVLVWPTVCCTVVKWGHAFCLPKGAAAATAASI